MSTNFYSPSGRHLGKRTYENGRLHFYWSIDPELLTEEEQEALGEVLEGIEDMVCHEELIGRDFS